MALTRNIFVVAVIAISKVSANDTDPTEIQIKNEIPSSDTFKNVNLKNRGTLLSLLLQERSLDRGVGSCGVRNPRCTGGCFDEDGTCVCHKDIGPYSWYIFPCKENDKICKEGEHKYFAYSKIDPMHTAALTPNHQCKKILQGVTGEEKQQILDIHNNFRAKVAQGQEHRSPHPGVSQPSGSNIKELIWNEELAYIAQKWANQCRFEHERNSSRRTPCSRIYDYVGENLYISFRSWIDTDNRWPEAIKSWYDEVADTPISLVKKYIWGVTSKMIGHYTQLVWAETYEIGCGAVHYSGSRYGAGSSTLYVCNYGPGGNMLGEEMYKIGQPASACGQSGKSSKYPGLCATRL